MQLHRRQPTRLRCPQDSLGKNTGVGCHFLLQLPDDSDSSKQRTHFEKNCFNFVFATPQMGHIFFASEIFHPMFLSLEYPWLWFSALDCHSSSVLPLCLIRIPTPGLLESLVCFPILACTTLCYRGWLLVWFTHRTANSLGGRNCIWLMLQNSVWHTVGVQKVIYW